MTTAGSPKLIKRYANRKLYDTKRSCYVTLDEIALMVKAGEDVKIVDNKTKEDMTAVTLAQIIFEQEKKVSRMPLSVLRGMIQQSGEALSDFFQRTVSTPVGKLQGEMEKTFERVFHRGDGERPDATQAEQEAAAEDKRNVVREFMDASSHTIEDWQKRVDEQVHRALSTMTNLTSLGSELQALRLRVAELEKTIEKLEG
jgi:polyhydroxyalkanoate synthesis repressor PhaR